MMQQQNHTTKICANNRRIFRKREMHRFFFLKEATEEPSSKTGTADRLCFSQLFRAGVQRDAIPLCWVQGCSALLGSRGNAHWQVKGGSHYRVKGETPCPGRVDALRQLVLGIT